MDSATVDHVKLTTSAKLKMVTFPLFVVMENAKTSLSVLVNPLRVVGSNSSSCLGTVAMVNVQLTLATVK